MRRAADTQRSLKLEADRPARRTMGSWSGVACSPTRAPGPDPDRSAGRSTACAGPRRATGRGGRRGDGRLRHGRDGGRRRRPAAHHRRGPPGAGRRGARGAVHRAQCRQRPGRPAAVPVGVDGQALPGRGRAPAGPHRQRGAQRPGPAAAREDDQQLGRPGRLGRVGAVRRAAHRACGRAALRPDRHLSPGPAGSVGRDDDDGAGPGAVPRAAAGPGPPGRRRPADDVDGLGHPDRRRRVRPAVRPVRHAGRRARGQAGVDVLRRREPAPALGRRPRHPGGRAAQRGAARRCGYDQARAWLDAAGRAVPAPRDGS